MNQPFKMSDQSKYWCLTLNNPSDEECDDIIDVCGLLDEDAAGHLTYIVIGFESGDCGTPHLQMYVEFGVNVRRSVVKATFGERIHAEVRKGSGEQAAAYCMKELGFVEHGRLFQPNAGRRTDLEGIRKLILKGRTELQIADAHFNQWCIYRRSFSAYRGLNTVQRRFTTRNYVLVGRTGTGKSRLVHSISPSLWVASDCTGRWFDGFSGQEDVLFDDFDGVGANIAVFLKLMDRYPMQVPIKGGFAEWNPKRIFFTSNTQIEQWFPLATPPQFDAFKRRVTGMFLCDVPLQFNANGRPSEPRFFELAE